MADYFEVAVSFKAEDNAGKEKKQTEVYLVQSLSFTESEARIIEQVGSIVVGEFEIRSIKRSKISEVVQVDVGEWYYKVVSEIVSLDEVTGKEKRIKEYSLVNADKLEEAILNFNEALHTCVVPYVLVSVMATNIVEVLHYDREKAVGNDE